MVQEGYQKEADGETKRREGDLRQILPNSCYGRRTPFPNFAPWGEKFLNTLLEFCSFSSQSRPSGGGLTAVTCKQGYAWSSSPFLPFGNGAAHGETHRALPLQTMWSGLLSAATNC